MRFCFFLLAILTLLDVRSQVFSDNKFLFKVVSSSSELNDHDTCSVYYKTSDDFKIRKAKSSTTWGDPRRARAQGYYYSSIFQKHFCSNGAELFNEALKKKALLDSSEDRDFDFRTLLISAKLTTLRASVSRLFNPEFDYRFKISFTVATRYDSIVFSQTASIQTPMRRYSLYMDNLYDSKTVANLNRYVDSLLLPCFMEMMSDDNLARMKKGVDSLIRMRSMVPPIHLKITNRLQPAKFSQYISSVVTIKLKEGHGSGCIISDDGYIVTNYHVVDKEENVSVSFSDGSLKEAHVVRVHPENDLALLKIDGAQTLYKPFFIKTEEEANIGTEVYAIGTPVDIDLGQTVSKGILSGTRKLPYSECFQVDIKISPGNSGGALIYKSGELIGIVNAKMVGAGIEGIGFAIPAKVVLNSLMLTYE